MTFTADKGPAPTPATTTVTVDPLGYALPAGVPTANGNPKKFATKFNLKNCGAAANNFTITAKAKTNVDADPTGPAAAVNIGPGAVAPITINGAKTDEHASGEYVIGISAPGAVSCSVEAHVE